MEGQKTFPIAEEMSTESSTGTACDSCPVDSKIMTAVLSDRVTPPEKPAAATSAYPPALNPLFNS